MTDKSIVPGPTYAEMRNPLLLSQSMRDAANARAATNSIP